ncbi:MAG: acylphosphatase [Coxiellaceae bacterium]|nr:MAG: acylphosphatase [Coxiellaceae bacterium]
MSLHCIVQGRVQGVYFRDSTRRKAQTLGVTGWVRNLPDGSVEVLMSGEAALVAQLREWLWQGPALAAVKT